MLSLIYRHSPAGIKRRSPDRTSTNFDEVLEDLTGRPDYA